MIHQQKTANSVGANPRAGSRNQLPSHAKSTAVAGLQNQKQGSRPHVNNQTPGGAVGRGAKTHGQGPGTHLTEGHPRNGQAGHARQSNQPGRGGREPAASTHAAVRKDDHRRVADQLAQSRRIPGKQMDSRTAKDILHKARDKGHQLTDSKAQKGTTKAGDPVSKALARLKGGELTSKGVVGTSAKTAFASLVGGPGGLAVALNTAGLLGDLASTLGFVSPYDSSIASLVADIEDKGNKGLDTASDLEALNDLVQLDQSAGLGYVAGVLESAISGSGESPFGEGGLDAASLGGITLADVRGYSELADSMMQTSLHSLGMSGIMMTQYDPGAMGPMASGPAVAATFPAQGVPATVFVSDPATFQAGPAEPVQPMVTSTTPATDAEAGATTTNADSGPVGANTLPAADPAVIPASTDSASGTADPEATPAAETRVVLVNPEDSGGPLSYRISGNHPYTIEPGYSQVLTNKPSWLVEFDRGESFGQARYNLGPGTYTFTATEKGWELYDTTFTVVLDNRANENEFNFVTDGQVCTVKAGESCTLTGKYAIVVSFDRGDGGEPCEKTCQSGTYRIGVNDKTQLLDLLADASDDVRNRDRTANVNR